VISTEIKHVMLLLAVLCPVISLAADPPGRANIVLIVADDLGYADLGCYGAKEQQTPHIDALASAGLRFTQFRVNPLCAPTRVAMLSGQYSLETGVWRAPNQTAEADSRQRHLHADLRLLPQFLKDAGYATGMFGKWHLGYVSPDLPNDRGFNEFVGFLGGAHPYEVRGAPILRNRTPIDDKRHLTDLFTDEAVRFIEAHHQRPFFCYVSFNAVHGPMWQPERPRTSGKPEWLARVQARGFDQPKRDYYAVLEHFDASVGRIVETLQRLKLAEHTLIVFVSDNGALEDKYPGNNGPLRGQKGMVYEGGIRVPAIVCWPSQIPAGSISDAPAMAFDLFSTCLAAAQVDLPRSNGRYPVHGLSLLEHARGGGRPRLPDRYLFWDLWGRLAAFHDGWKLVGQIDNHRGRFTEAVPQIEAAQFELYYLPDDLEESRDLAAAKPEVYADLKRRLIAWFKASTAKEKQVE
jgi:arylsulfatase A-like enzyme